MQADFDITIIGAGVIGLAVAAELSRHYDRLVVIEKHPAFGQETSSRNSEVIHSGIYYPTDSLKASLCVEGRTLLYNYCREKDIAYNKCGKLIVATDEDEVQQLNSLLKQAHANGVVDGKKMSMDEVHQLEPEVRAKAALYFPSSGIVDSHGLMKQLQTDCLNNQVDFAYRTELKGLRYHKDLYQVNICDENGSSSFTSRRVVNAAGLQSDQVAMMAGIYDTSYVLSFWKGEYFRLSGEKSKRISRLVYPVPHAQVTGLGVHATPDLGGSVRLGPNAIFMESRQEDYSVNPDHRADFYNSVNAFLPFVEEEDLRSDQAGIRPKLQRQGDPVRDFVIREESDRGFRGFVNLIGIESPGLTASLAIARYVGSLLALSDNYQN